MIRKAASKFLILAAVTLASGAVAVNCSKKSDKDDIGSVGLALVLPGGGIVNTVNYTISGDAPADHGNDRRLGAWHHHRHGARQRPGARVCTSSR